MIHGAEDTAVPVQSSYHLRGLLEEAGVDFTLRVAEGEEHMFDLSPTADLEGAYGMLFDEASAFLVKHLRK